MNQKYDQTALDELFSNEDFAKMWLKMHTPYLKKFKKVGRNDICPFCDSGKKLKNCECYEWYKNSGYTNKYENKE